MGQSLDEQWTWWQSNGRFVRRSGWVALLVPTALWLLLGGWIEQKARFDFRVYFNSVRSPDLYDYSYRSMDGRTAYPFTYPPIAAVVMGPFQWMSMRRAEYLWQVSSAVMMTTAMFIVVKEILRSHRLAEVWTPWLAAIGMWTLPVYLTLRLGQVNSLVVLPIVFDLVLLRRGSRWAGVGIGFAAALKLTPLLFIPFLLINGSLRRSGWTALATTTGLTVFAAAVRWHDSVRYWTKEIRATNRVGHLDSVLSSAFRRFTVWLPGPPVVSTLVWLVGSLALLGLVVAASRRLVARGLLPDLFVVIGVAACIVSPISWGHHLFFAVPALLVAAIRFRGRWAMVAALVCLAIFIDPFERGQGPSFSALQGVIMVVFVVAVCAQEIGTGLASTRSSSAEHRAATLSGDGGI